MINFEESTTSIEGEKGDGCQDLFPDWHDWKEAEKKPENDLSWYLNKQTEIAVEWYRRMFGEDKLSFFKPGNLADYPLPQIQELNEAFDLFMKHEDPETHLKSSDRFKTSYMKYRGDLQGNKVEKYYSAKEAEERGKAKQEQI